MNQDANALQWGIIGVGLLPQDKRMVDALEPQDALYTLVERQDATEQVTVIGALAGTIFAGESSDQVLKVIHDSAARIISLTVTENGYCLNAATKELDANHPLIAHDLAHPDAPRSAIGVVVEGYRRRMALGLPAFTCLTCDNIQHNGDVLGRAVRALARLRDPRLADWIEANARFPNTMVDRITPMTTLDDIGTLAARFGLDDQWPVFSELFRQWVIEDDFPAGRPAWQDVGAQFVSDVAPYEFMKLRLLNTSHLAIAGLGRLAGRRYVDEALRDPAMQAYMSALMDRETGPTLPVIPGIEISSYKAQLLKRFANSRIKDTVDRVNNDAPLNLLIDPIRDRLRNQASVELLTLALAAWMRRVRGKDDSDAPIPIVHPLASLLRERAIEGGPDPRPLLAIAPLFGELIENQGFVDSLQRWLELLYREGAHATLAQARRLLLF